MRNMMIEVLLVLLLCVVGFGFYRGWFSLSRSNPDTGSNSNKVNISLTVDPDKMKADTAMVKEKAIEPTAQVTAGVK